MQLKNPVAAPEHAAARCLRDAEPDGWRDRVGEAFRGAREHLRGRGLADLGNARERYRHPQAPDLLEAAG